MFSQLARKGTISFSLKKIVVLIILFAIAIIAYLIITKKK